MMEHKENECAMCGTRHTDVISRAQCEIACAEKKAEEERKAAELKKEAEYETRKAEVDEAFNKAYALKDEFVKDYGRYTYSKSSSNSAINSIYCFDWFGR
jgi:hypothetical protein